MILVLNGGDNDEKTNMQHQRSFCKKGKIKVKDYSHIIVIINQVNGQPTNTHYLQKYQLKTFQFSFLRN